MRSRSFAGATLRIISRAFVARRTANRIARGEAQLTPELHKLGLMAVADVKLSIASNTPPPNAPATVQRKGSSRTLIDTGDMLGAVTYELD